jgi:hypothetical protein
MLPRLVSMASAIKKMLRANDTTAPCGPGVSQKQTAEPRPGIT